MRTAKLLLILLVIGVIFIVLPSRGMIHASPAPYLNYQGRLENSNGDLLTGNYYIAFCIYNSTTATTCTPGSTPTVGSMSSAGTSSGTLNGALWGEVQYFSSSNTPSNEVENGVFNAELGKYSPLTGSIFENGSNFYIGVNVYNGSSWDGQMTPLEPIDQVAYSMDSALLNGYGASTTPGATQVVVTNSSGDITLSGTNPQINVEGTNTLTLNGGGGTGNIEFFNSTNYITSAGLMQLQGGIDTLGSSTSEIGVGTAGSGISGGVIEFNSNGSSGTDGGYMEYVPPASGTNIADELHISGSSGGTLTDLQLVTNALNISNSANGTTVSINGASGNITTAGNLTVNGSGSNTITGDTTLSNNLIVNGSSTTTGITNNGVLTNNGNGTFSGTLSVTGGSIDLGNSSSNLIESTTSLTLNPENINTGSLNINATTSLPATTYKATSVEYNGFIYEIGGYNGSAYVSTVYYAPINSNGSIGSWTATTSLPTTIDSATSVEYGGFVYEIGGYNGSAYVSTVYYAPINSGGSLGSWVATTSLPATIDIATSVEYGGFVYVIGGYNGSAYVSTVYYAPINSGGSIGSWTATTSLPAATGNATSVEYNGYVYEIGGCSSSCPTTTVYYAPINSNGSIGSWVATTSLPAATYGVTSVEYNGYVYEIGGWNGSTVVSTVYYAPINSNGSLGSWVATTSLPAATYGATSVEYNGYVYEIGGWNGRYVATVYYISVVSGNILLTNSVNNTNVLSMNGFSGNISTDGSINVGNINGGVNTINGNTILTSADLNISGLSVPTALSVSSSSNVGGLLNTGTYYYEVVAKDNTPASISSSFPSQEISATVNAVISVPSGVSTSVATTGSVGSNLAASTTYYYEVTATTPNGETTVSAEVTAAEGATAYPITISWTAVSGATGYTVYKGTTSGGEQFLAPVSGGSTTLYTDSGNTNTSGVNPPSSNTATTNTNEISLSWNSVPGATSYDIYRSNTPTFTSAVKYVSNTNSFIDTNASSTTSLPAARFYATSVEYGGFVYEIGGCCQVSTVYYAPINSNGTIGSWVATTSLPATTQSLTSIAYNGYVYVIGGYSGSADVATVDYAPINSNGTIGSWTATTSLPAATDAATSVVYNGYVYEIGGVSGNSCLSTVDYAPINSNGSIGSWTATTSLPAVTYDATSVEYNGFIYNIGGYDCGSGISTVDYAPINHNGTIGNWVATTSLPAALYDATSVEYNGFIYEIGGYNGIAAVLTVDYASINSNGTIGSWTATTSLPVATDNATSVEYNGFIYEIGGISTVGISTVDYFKVLKEGGMATPSKGSVQINTQVIQNGGGNLNLSGSVNIGGGLQVLGESSFGSAISLTNPNNNLIASAAPLDIQSSGFKINLGAGNNGTNPTTANPQISSWPATTSLPATIDAATSVEYGGFVYEIGGFNGSSTVATVYYAPINSGGSIGSWVATTSLPATISNATSVEYGGFVYEIGGWNASAYVSTVYYAPINSGGSIGSWTATTSLPTATGNATSVEYNGFIYEIGGYNGSANVSTVYYAPINSGGSIGSWTATTSLPATIDAATSVEYGGFVYEIGGYNGSALATVYYAPINSGGTIGSWVATTSLPVALLSATSVEYNGFIYEIEGNNAGTIVSTVYYAPINSGGTIGSWTATTSLPAATDQATSVEYGGFVYEIGGYNGSANVATVDYSSQLIAQPSSNSGYFTVSASSGGMWNDIFSIDPLGNAILSGTLTTGGIPADIAEDVKVGLGATSGDIVSVSGVNSSSSGVNNFEAVPTMHAYSQNILGVISTDPSITLHKQNIPGLLPLALAGRVLVKVTNYNGNIQTGDMITGSQFKGLGEKATNAGQVVGMALNSLTSSTPGARSFTYNGANYIKGEILMLVKNEYYNPVSNTQGLYTDILENGGTVSIQGNLDVSGNILIGGDILSKGMVPEVSVTSNGGVGSKVSILGTDVTGSISFTSGSSAVSSGDTINVTFNKGYTSVPNVLLTALNSTGGMNMNNVYVKENTSGFSIYFIKAIQPNEILKWNYTVTDALSP